MSSPRSNAVMEDDDIPSLCSDDSDDSECCYNGSSDDELDDQDGFAAFEQGECLMSHVKLFVSFVSM
jgi:hypothetical protein